MLKKAFITLLLFVCVGVVQTLSAAPSDVIGYAAHDTQVASVAACASCHVADTVPIAHEQTATIDNITDPILTLTSNLPGASVILTKLTVVPGGDHQRRYIVRNL